MKTLKTIVSFVLVFIFSVSLALAGKEVRLNITNGIFTDEMLVAIHDGATDGFEMYDSPKMAVNVADYPEIYSFAGTQQVSINGIPPISYNDVKVYQLGYRISSASSLTILVKNIANLDSGTVVFLKDNVLNVEKELTLNSEYTFTTAKGETNNRFNLVFKRSEVAPTVVTTNPVVTTPVSADTTVAAPVVPEPIVAPIVSEPVIAPVVSTLPDFNVLVLSSRTLEVQLLNLPVKGTKITVNSINGRRVLGESATGDRTYISTPLAKGQYLVTVSNKSFTKSKNILVY